MGTDRQNGSLYTKIEKGVAVVEFGHPQANSFPLELLLRLEKELDLISQNDEIKMVVLKSEGETTFCAGASFSELIQVDSFERGKEFFSGFARVLNGMRRCSKPIIGRAQGKSVGGGVGILAACDYVFATEAASIKLSEISIGIGPFVIAPAVERKMGVGAFAELTLTPDQWKNAYWAERKGLYARVFETIAEMDNEITYFTEKLSSYPLSSLEELKKSFWRNTEHWETLLFENAEISGKLILSDFSKQILQKLRK